MCKAGQQQQHAREAVTATPNISKEQQQQLKKKEPDVPTLAEIRAVVPAHCFERSLVRSSLYLLRDLALVGVLFYAARTWLPTTGVLTNPLAIAAWAAYTVVQGTAMTGLWVLAHECGHQAFSPYRFVNDAVGFVLHSALLVPYWSWAYSHGVHHARVNHMLDGESHVPDLERKVKGAMQRVVDFIGEDAFALVHVVLHLLLGWPLYLLLGITGAKRRPDGERFSKSALKKPNHFNPWSELFPDRMRVLSALSTAGVLATLVVLRQWASVEGWGVVTLQYVLPYLIVNAYLVGFTWLQHTHPEVPHLGADTWTWMEGTLLTVDRPFPAFIDVLTHRIGSTHVCHHIFSKMPWYHAQEATRHIRAFLEPRGCYNYDGMVWYKALMHTGRHCHFVEDVNGVQYFKRVVPAKAAKQL